MNYLPWFAASSACVAFSTISLSAQGAQPARAASALLSAVPTAASLAAASSATELTIRWVVTPSATGDPVAPADITPINQFEIIGRRSVAAGFVRERAPELSPDHLVVVIVDASGRETGWQQIRDPRLIRAEIPGPGGVLSGQILYRPQVELVVPIPDGLSAAAIRIYEAEPIAGDFMLRELAEVTAVVP